MSEISDWMKGILDSEDMEYYTRNPRVWRAVECIRTYIREWHELTNIIDTQKMHMPGTENKRWYEE